MRPPEVRFCQPANGTLITPGIIANRELYEMPGLTGILDSFAKHQEDGNCDELTLTAV